jgi:hypothetical protein
MQGAMSISRALVPVVVGLAVAACQDPGPPTDTVDQGVVGAELDPGDPGVVALTTGGNVFCTGTLVSPRVVATAGHCVDKLTASASVFFGSLVGGTGQIATIERTESHPMWNGNLANGHDVGMVLLNTAQDPDIAVPLSPVDLATMIGEEYRVVGFGIHDRDTGELDGNKRTAIMEIESVDGDYVEITDVDPSSNPDTAICQGDSGGPGLITVDGVEQLAGIHSYSIKGCFNPSGDSRVSVFLADFIQPWIDANDPTCGADGTCARIGCTDDPDCQPCGADGTCAASCELPDVDCPTQDLGEICRGDTQCMSGLCVYWDGDPRVKFCSQPCGGGCPDGMSCKNVLPFGDVCYYVDVEPPGTLGSACDDPTDCAEYLCEAGACTYTCSIPDGRVCEAGFLCEDHGMGARCYPDPDAEDGGGGGCAASRGAGAGSLAGLALALALVLRRRR